MKFTAGQIAAMVNGTVEGNPDIEINALAKIEEGREGAISFLSNPKYEKYIYDTGSSVVLVRREFVPEHPVKATLIKVDDPYATIASLLKMVGEMLTPRKSGVEQPSFVAPGVEIPEGAYIGAFAYVGTGAKLGKNVKIYPQAYVGDGCVIGDDTIVYAGARIYHGCRIGARCVLHSGCVIGADGFGFAPVDGHYDKIPQIGNVVLGDDVEIGANTTVDRATMGSTFVDRGVKLDNLIQVAHNCHIGEDTVVAAQAGFAGSSKVGRHCMIGGQVGVAGHIALGDNVEVAAQSGLHKGLADGSRVFGTPAMDFKAYLRKSVDIKGIPAMEKRIKELEKMIEQK